MTEPNPEPKREEMSYRIEIPIPGDEMEVGPMQVQAWHESYLHPELGITDDVIQDTIAFVATQDGNDFRQAIFTEMKANPDKVIYRVVKNEQGKIVGFMHGKKHENTNELDGIYLLDEAKGSGIGDKLMEEFLAWINKTKPTTLEIIAFNDRALKFYEKYGFETTDEKFEPFNNKFPIVGMVKQV